MLWNISETNKPNSICNRWKLLFRTTVTKKEMFVEEGRRHGDKCWLNRTHRFTNDCHEVWSSWCAASGGTREKQSSDVGIKASSDNQPHTAGSLSPFNLSRHVFKMCAAFIVNWKYRRIFPDHASDCNLGRSWVAGLQRSNVCLFICARHLQIKGKLVIRWTSNREKTAAVWGFPLFQWRKSDLSCTCAG